LAQEYSPQLRAHGFFHQHRPTHGMEHFVREFRTAGVKISGQADIDCFVITPEADHPILAIANPAPESITERRVSNEAD
jgi:hypothetical protein